MQTKFSEDVIPLSDFKVNPEKTVNQANDTHRPVLLTNRGRGIAVVQGLDDYENIKEELDFVKSVARGLMEIKAGEDVADVFRKRLDVGDQVLADVVLVAHQFLDVERRRVVKKLPRLLQEERLGIQAGLLAFLLLLEHGLLRRIQNAVEAS